MMACENSGHSVEDDFPEVRKIVDAGYMGLYGGLDVDDIHKRKNLEIGQKMKADA